LELAEAGEVPTDRRAEPVVDGQGEPGASARGGQDEVRTVLADRDEAQLLHACPSCPVLMARRTPDRPAVLSRPAARCPPRAHACPFPRIPESLFRTHLLPAPYPACPNIAALEALFTRSKRAPDQACPRRDPRGGAMHDSCATFSTPCLTALSDSSGGRCERHVTDGNTRFFRLTRFGRIR